MQNIITFIGNKIDLRKNERGVQVTSRVGSSQKIKDLGFLQNEKNHTLRAARELPKHKLERFTGIWI